jgi:SAM-dependent methyltransferase
VQYVFRALLYGIVATVEGLPGLGIADGSLADAGPRAQNSRRAAAGQPARGGPAPSASLFTRLVIDYAAQRPGRAVSVLQAGCTTGGGELDVAAVHASGHAVAVSLVDEATPVTRAAVASRPDLTGAVLGELRMIQLRPRSFDIVQCSLLLHRVTCADVVLSRLAAAVRPGGLLMLRIADPRSVTGFLDRRLPRAVRALAWHAARPGQPGPHAAVYEPVATARGIEAFAGRHGLAVAHRGVARSGGALGGPSPAGLIGRLVAWLSRGRLTGDHDELCYIIRKPEDRFARVLP